MAAGGFLLAHLLHAALLLAAAPLVEGLTRAVLARLEGRRGASPVQPYRDLARAWRRRPVLAAGASPVAAAAPLVAVGALALAAGLLPPLFFPAATPATLVPAPAGPPVGFNAAPAALSGDLVLIAALLGLSRFALALALLDTGTAAGGLGAARSVARPVLFEPALLLVASCLAALAGTEAAGARAPVFLATMAVLVVAASEVPRPPVVGAAGGTPHDLGEAPEAVGTEFSGWRAALWDYARALRRAVFLALAAALLPGPPAWTGAAGAALQPLLGLAEFAAVCVLLAALESGLAASRPERLPAFGAGAAALAAVAAALLFLGGVAA